MVKGGNMGLKGFEWDTSEMSRFFSLQISVEAYTWLGEKQGSKP